ncbi:MAG: type II secretion system F family protein [Paracoccaceae bacterium]
MSFAFLDGLREFETALYIGVFIGVLLVFAGLQEIFAGRTEDEGERNRRMRMIRKGSARTRFSRPDRRSPGHRPVGDGADRKDAAQPAPRGPVDRAARGLPGHRGAGVAFYFLLSLKIPGQAAMVLAALLGLLLPYAVIENLATERLKKLTTQLPDALDMMARGLKIGHPLNVTLKRVAEQMPDPIGTEFGLIEDRIRHGADVPSAIAEFAGRFQSEDTHYFAACVAIQHGTGGNLGQVLRVLSRVIRDRINMRTRIRAVSGEGRISAFILSLMPFLIVGAIYTSSPRYYTDVMDHPAFMPVAWGVLAMVIAQALILRRLATFDF